MSEVNERLLRDILHGLAATLSVALGDLPRAPAHLTAARLNEAARQAEWAIEVLEEETSDDDGQCAS